MMHIQDIMQQMFCVCEMNYHTSYSVQCACSGSVDLRPPLPNTFVFPSLVSCSHHLSRYKSYTTGLLLCTMESWYKGHSTLQWRHNGRDCVSYHESYDCLLNHLFRRRSKKISKLRVTGLCAGNSPVTGEFPAQMVSNAENVSIWWRHHENPSRLAIYNP